MRYDEVMTSGTPQVGKIGSFVCAYVVVFLVTHVGAHLRLLHTQISQVE